MRLLYLTDWLPPDFGAVGQYSLIFARQRAAEGHQVCLVGLSSTARSQAVEAIGGGRLTIRRLRRTTYDRARFAQRAWWTLTTNLQLLWAAGRELWQADEVLFTGSPPFLVHFLVPLNILLRHRLVYRITDFHPECLIAELGRAALWLRLLQRWTILLRRRVDRLEVLGEDQRRRLVAMGIPRERIVLKPDPAPVAFPPDVRPLPPPAPLAGRCVVLYSGNFGVAHDHRTLVEAFRRHHATGTGRVALWLNATGAKADLIETELRSAGLPIHRGSPLPLADLPALLVSPAAHLITLRDEFVGYVLPSKVHACIASGRPVIFVGSEQSDVHALCARDLPASRYRRIAVGDSRALAEVFEEIADEAERERRSERMSR